MRLLTILLLALAAVRAQSSESQVEAVLHQMERAEQTGDFNSWLALWISSKSAEMEQLRPYARARPEVRYRPIRSFARGDQAVILVQGGPNGFVTMTLRKEGGQWKIANQLFRDTAPNPNSVYALLPPAPGAFARDGSLWDRLPPALDPKAAPRLPFQMKAVFDESFLYIRIESNVALPAPGATIQSPPGGWPNLKITTSTAGEFVLFDTVNVGDQATFDEHGKANSHRPYAAYMIRLERDRREVFSASADLDPSPLIDVAGRNYDIRIPLAAMGIADSRSTRITVGDAQWPKSALVSHAVHRYPL